MSSKDPRRPCPAHRLSTERINFQGCFPEAACYSSRPGRRPPPLPSFLPPTSCSWVLPQLGRGSWGGQGFPATESIDTAPLHQLKSLAVLRQGSATLGPKEPFPGLGLEERHPSQAVRSGSDFLSPGCKVVASFPCDPTAHGPRKHTDHGRKSGRWARGKNVPVGNEKGHGEQHPRQGTPRLPLSLRCRVTLGQSHPLFA